MIHKGYFYYDNESEVYKNNKDSNKVDSFKLKEGKGTMLFYAQDEDYFIFITKDENGEKQLVMADKSQIGTINSGVIEHKPLCKYKWFVPENSPYIVVEEDKNEPTQEKTT